MGKIKFSKNKDIENYYFDIDTCILSFESFVSNINKLKLVLVEHQKNVEIEIKGYKNLINLAWYTSQVCEAHKARNSLSQQQPNSLLQNRQYENKFLIDNF